jgi:hypothetical protein
MMDDLDKAVLGEVKSAISDSIRKMLGDGYNSPLKPIINRCFSTYGSEIEAWLKESIDAVMLDESFRAAMKEGMRKKIAKEITNSFGEGIFKQSIDKLKADPTLKARCIIAVEKILAQTEREKG